jgi:hypothetical protein
MSTNYYIGYRDGRVAPGNEQDVHIGLRAFGWVFQFQGKVCKTVEEWRQRLLDLPGEYVIVAENGAVFERDEFDHFWKMVEGTKSIDARNVRSTEDRPGWRDQGFDFCNYEFC